MTIKIHHLPHGFARNKPGMIVIHAMGEFIMSNNGHDHDYAIDFLDQQGLSAHALVTPDGTIYRLRHDAEGAYHARGFNQDSLGIEILVAGKHDYGSFLEAIKKPYLSDAQYAALLGQCRDWMHAHDIKQVVRHSTLSPGRKMDPGAGFPWDVFLADLHHDAVQLA